MAILELRPMVADSGVRLDPKKTDDFARVSLNTHYIIHPEEILADQFTYLGGRRAGLSGPPLDAPEVVDALEAQLSTP